jgi:hypothetical protein
MKLSDQELRGSLASRVARTGATDSDYAPVARVIATSALPRSSTSASGWRRLVATGSTAAAIAVLLILANRPPSSSPGVAPSVGPTIAATQTASASRVLASQLANLPITGCDALAFSPARCRAVVARARDGANPPLRSSDVVAATLTPPDRAGGVLLGSMPVASVHFDLTGGGSTDVVVHCGLPGLSDRACNDNAVIYVAGGVDHDVPCTGEAPEHPCATLPPSPRPASVTAAVPLRVPLLDVPLGHLGHYEIPVGPAGLPDGVLSERSAGLSADAPTTFWIDDGVRIDVRPDDPSRPPIGSIYRAPFQGVEPIHVFLVFDVVELEPGAVLQVRDLVVR